MKLLKNKKFTFPNPQLIGEHQIENASTAIASTMQLMVSTLHLTPCLTLVGNVSMTVTMMVTSGFH